MICPTKDPYAGIVWEKRDVCIRKANGDTVFEQKGVEVASTWSMQATQIVADKYLRKINGVKETSVRQMIDRVVGAIKKEAASRKGLFDSTMELDNWAADLTYLLVHQMWSFNSPVWFNIGVPGVEQQASACFIQPVEDNLESITSLMASEMRLFKRGSGTGTNFSTLRSSYEGLSNGGTSSGVVSFMKVFDTGAGVIKSGGATRRAAKIVILNVDHPDILECADGTPGFIRCKADAEEMAHALYATGLYSAEFNVPNNVYSYVPFQNANHSVRVTDEFMQAVERDGAWCTIAVTDPAKTIHQYRAQELFLEICKAAHVCGDPGLQFDTAINKMFTLAGTHTKINASNPCSEYMHIDNSACNLGSFNLIKFINFKENNVDYPTLQEAVGIVTIAMDLLVDMSVYPTEAIRINSLKYRPLGIGFANLAGLLMDLGLPYDSDKARVVASKVTSTISSQGYITSAQLAKKLGKMEDYERNKSCFLDVLKKHRDAFDGFHSATWNRTIEFVRDYGVRNSQICVVAPTGTIAFMMDCDGTGIEPLPGLLCTKKLVGGGEITVEYDCVKRALRGNVTPKDAPLFATAFGTPTLSPEAHLLMMAAVQPYVSGAISKTINLPATATVEDIRKYYMMAWKLGLKSVALYRDGCKLSQPISTKKETEIAAPSAPPAPPAPPELPTSSSAPDALRWGQRLSLPAECVSTRTKVRLGGQEGYLHVGWAPDGRPLEVFIRMIQIGSPYDGAFDALAVAMSIGLQYGVPMDVFVKKLEHMRFEPYGSTWRSDFESASSIADFLAKWFKTHKSPMLGVDAPLALREVKPDAPAKGSNSALVGPPCSNCGAPTTRTSSCFTCRSCGTNNGCG